MTHLAAQAFGRALQHGLGRSVNRRIRATLSAAAATQLLLLPRVALGHSGHAGLHPLGTSGNATIPVEASLTAMIPGAPVARWIVKRQVQTGAPSLNHRGPALRSRALLAATLAVVIASPVLAADPNLATPAPAPTTDPSEQLAGPTAVAPLGPNVLIYGPTSGHRQRRQRQQR